MRRIIVGIPAPNSMSPRRFKNCARRGFRDSWLYVATSGRSGTPSAPAGPVLRRPLFHRSGSVARRPRGSLRAERGFSTGPASMMSGFPPPSTRTSSSRLPGSSSYVTCWLQPTAQVEQKTMNTTAGVPPRIQRGPRGMVLLRQLDHLDPEDPLAGAQVLEGFLGQRVVHVDQGDRGAAAFVAAEGHVGDVDPVGAEDVPQEADHARAVLVRGDQ